MATARSRETAAYYPQINTLRFLAVALVFAWHWARPIMSRAGLDGGYGVWLFFAISGYLITDILLRNKDSIDSGAITRWQAFKIFYIRRSIRIFPIYYLALAISVAFGVLTLGQSLWYFAYLSNIHFIQLGDFGPMGHLWSLSVEEQFYLFWPLLLFVVPMKRLPFLLYAAILLAVSYRVIACTAQWGVAIHLMPVSCFDTLGAGALLAYWRRSPSAAHRLRALQIAGPLALLALAAIGFAPSWPRNVFAPLLVGMGGAWLIDRCVGGVGGVMGRVLSFRPFLYLGQISYGLYLYHGWAPAFVPDRFGEDLGAGYWLGLVVTATTRAALVVVIASISWFLIEQPMNRLKRYWTIGSAKSPAAAASEPPAGAAAPIQGQS